MTQREKEKLQTWKRDVQEVKGKRKKRKKAENLSERDIKQLMQARSYERHNGAIRNR